MKTKHTPGPWMWEDSVRHGRVLTHLEDGYKISHGTVDNDEDAARIVLCVNELEGFDFKPGAVRELVEAAFMALERGEQVAYEGQEATYDHWEPARDRLRTALAALKGERHPGDWEGHAADLDECDERRR